MGLLEEIEKSAKAPSTLEEFKEELNKGLWEQLDHNNKRQFTVMTGSRGFQLFHDQMQRQALLSILEDMSTHFTEEEMSRIKQMINSEDIENLTVAQAIINQKLKPYGHSE